MCDYTNSSPSPMEAVPYATVTALGNGRVIVESDDYGDWQNNRLIVTAGQVAVELPIYDTDQLTNLIVELEWLRSSIEEHRAALQEARKAESVTCCTDRHTCCQNR